MNPEDTRDCDGFPGLAAEDRIKEILTEAGFPARMTFIFSGDVTVRADDCPCGDAGDCSGCS